ncbi:hypothetical protein ABMA28_000588 [Loxostege sticticalis]|uniref:Uncharacterized protein n=1 Tax=Loxostege sticticalis TaxID=481309 RepID=A0ABD0TSX9_LOXSC
MSPQRCSAIRTRCARHAWGTAGDRWTRLLSPWGWRSWDRQAKTHCDAATEMRRNTHAVRSSRLGVGRRQVDQAAVLMGLVELGQTSENTLRCRHRDASQYARGALVTLGGRLATGGPGCCPHGVGGVGTDKRKHIAMPPQRCIAIRTRCARYAWGAAGDRWTRLLSPWGWWSWDRQVKTHCNAAIEMRRNTHAVRSSRLGDGWRQVDQAAVPMGLEALGQTSENTLRCRHRDASQYARGALVTPGGRPATGGPGCCPHGVGGVGTDK